MRKTNRSPVGGTPTDTPRSAGKSRRTQPAEYWRQALRESEEDLENDAEIEKQFEETRARSIRQEQPASTPQQPRIDNDRITIARHEAKPGQMCNPWDDRCHFLPLLNNIARRKDMSAGDKVFHAAVVRRFFLCSADRRGLPTDKLAEETGSNVQMVRRRLLKLQKLKLVARGKFDSWTLVNERNGVQAKAQEYASRIPRKLLPYASPQQLVVYSRLALLAGPKGWWFGTNEKLMEYCGVRDLRTLRQAVRGLEDLELLRVDRQIKRSDAPQGHRTQGGGWNVYYFLGHQLFRK